MNIEIPKNTYSVDADPVIAETIKKCIAELSKSDNADIIRHPQNDWHRKNRTCVDDDYIGFEVCKHFVMAGYHAAVQSYLGIVQYFAISKKPIDKRLERHIIG